MIREENKLNDETTLRATLDYLAENQKYIEERRRIKDIEERRKIQYLLTEIAEEDRIEAQKQKEANPDYYMLKKSGCGACKRANKILSRLPGTLRSEVIGEDMKQAILTRVSEEIGEDWRTFPCIWRNGKWIGGCSDLEEYLKT